MRRVTSWTSTRAASETYAAYAERDGNCQWKTAGLASIPAGQRLRQDAQLQRLRLRAERDARDPQLRGESLRDLEAEPGPARGRARLLAPPRPRLPGRPPGAPTRG